MLSATSPRSSAGSLPKPHRANSYERADGAAVELEGRSSPFMAVIVPHTLPDPFRRTHACELRPDSLRSIMVSGALSSL